eukprot:TRINITY_DN2112_c0_g1_i1.p1 TRINITY_DN2112_c0_g1~~TRINITY_DN2112_c0_g1_i1.p1  ORF type:complete len:545 (-),score=98.87 TRINITY_DN2112_c0_g1_i1:3779-5413(-)
MMLCLRDDEFSHILRFIGLKDQVTLLSVCKKLRFTVSKNLWSCVLISTVLVERVQSTPRYRSTFASIPKIDAAHRHLFAEFDRPFLSNEEQRQLNPENGSFEEEEYDAMSRQSDSHDVAYCVFIGPECCEDDLHFALKSFRLTEGSEMYKLTRDQVRFEDCPGLYLVQRGLLCDFLDGAFPQYILPNAQFIQKLAFCGLCSPIVPVLSSTAIHELRRLYVPLVSENQAHLRCLKEFIKSSSKLVGFDVSIDLTCEAILWNQHELADMLQATRDLTSFSMTLEANFDRTTVEVNSVDIQECEQLLWRAIGGGRADFALAASPHLEEISVINNVDMVPERCDGTVSNLHENFSSKSLRSATFWKFTIALGDALAFTKNSFLERLALTLPETTGADDVSQIMDNVSLSIQRLSLNLPEGFSLKALPMSFPKLQELTIGWVSSTEARGLLRLLSTHQDLQKNLEVLQIWYEASSDVPHFEVSDVSLFKSLKILSLSPGCFQEASVYVASEEIQNHIGLVSELKFALPKLMIFSSLCSCCQMFCNVWYG